MVTRTHGHVDTHPVVHNEASVAGASRLALEAVGGARGCSLQRVARVRTGGHTVRVVHVGLAQRLQVVRQQDAGIVVQV